MMFYILLKNVTQCFTSLLKNERFVCLKQFCREREGDIRERSIESASSFTRWPYCQCRARAKPGTCDSKVGDGPKGLEPSSAFPSKLSGSCIATEAQRVGLALLNTGVAASGLTCCATMLALQNFISKLIFYELNVTV